MHSDSMRLATNRLDSLYLSLVKVAALGGLIEELQQSRPAVRCLVFDHHRAELGKRVLHRVSAK